MGIYLQIEVSAGHVAVSAFILDKLHLFFGVTGVANHHIGILVGGTKVSPLYHLHAHVGQAGRGRYLLRLPSVLHEAMHRERLIGQEIGLAKTGAQRISVMGHQPELAGIQLDGCVFGVGVSVAIEPDGLCVVDLHLEIVNGGEVFQIGFGLGGLLGKEETDGAFFRSHSALGPLRCASRQQT